MLAKRMVTLVPHVFVALLAWQDCYANRRDVGAQLGPLEINRTTNTANDTSIATQDVAASSFPGMNDYKTAPTF